MIKWLKQIFSKIETLFIILLFISFLAKYIPIGHISYLPILAFFFPLGLFILGFYYMIRIFKIRLWKWKEWALFLFFIFQLLNFFQWSIPERQADSLKVMTFNIKSLLYKSNLTRSDNYHSINTFVTKEKPDIICLQETHWRDMLLLHPYGTTSKSTYSISSKYPIINEGTFIIDQETKHVRNIFADIVYKKDTIRVYNLHLESYKFVKENYEVINHLDDYLLDNKPGLGTGIKSTLKKLNFGYIAKGKQVSLIEEHIKSSPYPVIVCGDFNDISHSNAYYRLSKNLNDSFKSKGQGFGGSMNTISLPLRIDHVLYSDAFYCLNHTVFRENLSDHQPILVEFIK